MTHSIQTPLFALALDPELTSQLFLLTMAIISALVTYVVLPLIRIYGEKLAAKVEAETNESKYAAATRHLKELVADAVLEVEQTFVRKMKAHGQWDSEAARIARDTSVDVVRRHLGEGISVIMEALGITDASVMMGKLRTMVEAEVARANGGPSRADESSVFVPMLSMVDDESA